MDELEKNYVLNEVLLVKIIWVNYKKWGYLQFKYNEIFHYFSELGKMCFPLRKNRILNPQ